MHAGAEAGSQTQLLIMPKAGVFALVLTNTDGNDDLAAQKMMKTLLGSMPDSWSSTRTRTLPPTPTQPAESTAPTPTPTANPTPTPSTAVPTTKLQATTVAPDDDVSGSFHCTTYSFMTV